MATWLTGAMASARRNGQWSAAAPQQIRGTLVAVWAGGVTVSSRSSDHQVLKDVPAGPVYEAVRSGGGEDQPVSRIGVGLERIHQVGDWGSFQPQRPVSRDSGNPSRQEHAPRMACKLSKYVQRIL